ncbi:hypothetical protein [Nitrosomonas communis]|uniref:Uncharacterized protein n=1 Tax=Nitrosomonas communis TaxID=44574 RepID=A0A1H2Y400_9PROT|nr:hypothetical protein [Nitrosomonas communis]SDW99404.1 hypothetical protein SAMN05421882_10465 [Nitrosomonas communis]
MSLPVQEITKYPLSDPVVLPELSNHTYQEIAQNFANLDERALSVEDEITASIFGKIKLALIIGRIISQIGGLKRILNGTATPASYMITVCVLGAVD